MELLRAWGASENDIHAAPQSEMHEHFVDTPLRKTHRG
jgi:hypothetical protein